MAWPDTPEQRPDYRPSQVELDKFASWNSRCRVACPFTDDHRPTPRRFGLKTTLSITGAHARIYGNSETILSGSFRLKQVDTFDVPGVAPAGSNSLEPESKLTAEKPVAND